MRLGLERLLPSGRAHIVDVRPWERTVVDLLGGRVVGPAPIGFAGALKSRLLARIEESFVLASLARLSALLRLTGGRTPGARRMSPLSGGDRHGHEENQCEDD
jgi:hypothetical protein